MDRFYSISCDINSQISTLSWNKLYEHNDFIKRVQGTLSEFMSIY